MSISLVYKSTKPAEVEAAEVIFANKLSSSLDYDREFVIAHPEAKIFGTLQIQPGAGIEITEDTNFHFEMEFPDQTLLDLYLADSRNMKTVFENFIVDSEVVSYCSVHNITQTLQTLNNTDKTGIPVITVEDME